VPERILSAERALRPHERAVIELHPRVGFNIIGQVPALRDVADAVLYHHERFDGGGYPDGLAGERIPLLARIVCVVDAYDAMTHERAYRRALSADEARMRLALGAGHQFDPAVVRAYLEELHDDDEQRFGREAAIPDPPSPLV
jgi:HD-GYP domain-containing protein (c-di-GMP phosphodiesterase class II)